MDYETKKDGEVAAKRISTLLAGVKDNAIRREIAVCMMEEMHKARCSQVLAVLVQVSTGWREPLPDGVTDTTGAFELEAAVNMQPVMAALREAAGII